MDTVLIVIHLMVVVALVGVVLLQRSEGGALGMGGGGGGGGGSGGFMSARGAANALTRATAILAAIFFATSLTLGYIAKNEDGAGSILDRVPVQQESSEDGGSGGILDQLQPTAPTDDGTPQVPNSQ